MFRRNGLFLSEGCLFGAVVMSGRVSSWEVIVVPFCRMEKVELDRKEKITVKC